MSRIITNEVLYNEIKHVKEHMSAVEKHLKDLNGQVGNNTLALGKQGVLNWIHGIATTVLVVGMIRIVFFGGG